MQNFSNLNDFIYSLTRQKMKAKVVITAEIGLEKTVQIELKKTQKNLTLASLIWF